MSLCWLKVVPVSALSAFSLGLLLVTMLVTCGANAMEVYVTPRILVSCVCGIEVLLSVAAGLCWSSL